MINIYNLSLNANIEQRAQCSMVQLSMSTLVYTIDTHLTRQKVLNQITLTVMGKSLLNTSWPYIASPKKENTLLANFRVWLTGQTKMLV